MVCLVRARRAAVALAPALLAVGAWAAFLADRAPGTDAALRGFPLDDAWIHMVYARSLVTQGGFNYNDGVPETGMTSPLWVVVLAVVRLLTGGSIEAVVIGAKVASLAFGVAGVVALRRLALALGAGRGAAFLAACLAALDPSLTFSRAAGMEVPLFVFLVIAALLAAVRGRPIAAGVAAGLSVVARPEGVVIFPVVFALLLRREVRARPGAWRRLALATVAAIAPAAAYSLFCLAATGFPLPNTFYAKFHAANPLSLSTLAFGWGEYVRENLPYFTLEAGIVLATVGAAWLVRRSGLVGLAPLATGILLFVSVLSTRAYSPGHYYYWERWLIPAFPFLILGIASGVGALWAGLGGLRASLLAKAGTASNSIRAVLAAAVVALVVWPMPSALRARADLFAWNCQNIEEMNVVLGRWVDANVPRDAVVAVNDAGALRYFGRRATVDLIGLNDHKILRRDASEGFRTLEQRGVSHFVIFPSWFPGIERLLPLTQVHEVRSPHYTICEGPQDQMVVYRWERR